MFEKLKHWQKGALYGIIFWFGCLVTILLVIATPSEPGYNVGLLMISALMSFVFWLCPVLVISAGFGWLYAKFRSGFLITLVILVLIGMGFLAVFLGWKKTVHYFCSTHAECQIPAEPDQPQWSPSGRYRLEVKTGQDAATYVQFQVIETTRQNPNVKVYKTIGKVLAPDDKFYTRHRTYIMWDDAIDRVWVYSGDVGTRFWDQLEDDRWQQFICQPPDASLEIADPPTYLKETMGTVGRWAKGCYYEKIKRRERVARCESNDDCVCLSRSGVPFIGCSNIESGSNAFAGFFECNVCQCVDGYCEQTRVYESNEFITEPL